MVAAQRHNRINFRWFWDYAGGLMTDWGVHMLNIVFWSLGQQAPKTITSTSASPTAGKPTPWWAPNTANPGNCLTPVAVELTYGRRSRTLLPGAHL